MTHVNSHWASDGGDRRAGGWVRALRPAQAKRRAARAPITCTNPASGASWQIKIDYDRGTVDSNPARISDAEISWHDAADGWNYTLDRKSGISR